MVDLIGSPVNDSHSLPQAPKTYCPTRAPPPPPTNQAMDQPKPYIIRFKFRDFVGIPSEPGDYVYSDRVYDRRNGNAWQLQLYPGGTGEAPSSSSSDGDNDDDDNDNDRGGGEEGGGAANAGGVLVSVFLHNVDGPDVDARTAFILRDARGGVRHRTSTDIVDRYVALRECFGYFSFVGRSTILDDGVLLGGTLVIDVEVRMPGRRLAA